jgi:hypothetical protein
MDCFHYSRRPNPFPRELWQAPPIFSALILNHDSCSGVWKCDSITNPEEVDLSVTKTCSASLCLSGPAVCIFDPRLDYLAE